MGKKSRRNRESNPPTPAKQLKKRSAKLATNPDDTRNKYIVARTDFRRLPRWPNDGIEAEKEKFKSGESENFHCDTDDPEQIALTQLLGGYPCGQPLDQMTDRSFVTSLPHMMQHRVATQQSDLDAAKDHLIEAYRRKDPNAMQLIKSFHCQKAIYKASQDRTRFPAFHAILVPMFQMNLATDSNIETLFGEVSRVRHLLLEIGASVAEPPHAHSPEDAFLSQYYIHPETKPTVDSGGKTCAECGTSNDNCFKCTACKTVHYCNRECQRKHWPIHKPECHEAQGKNISKSAIAKAEEAKKTRQENREQLEKERTQQAREAFRVANAEFVYETSMSTLTLSRYWAHDCYGKRLRIHVPSLYAQELIEVTGLSVDLEKTETLSLGMYPDGIDDTKFGFRGLLLRRSSNGANVIILFERLFAQSGEGGGVGVCVQGAFVVDKVVDNKAKWKLVGEPKEDPNENRRGRLVMYLKVAKARAIAVPNGVDLGIHNAGDPTLSITPTAAGDRISVR